MSDPYAQQQPGDGVPYGAYPHSPYPQGPGYGMQPPAGNNGLAVAAMVLGIIGLITSMVFIGGLLGVIGLILGIVALAKARRVGAGRGMAIAGVVTSSIAIVVSILLVVFTVWIAHKAESCEQYRGTDQYQQCVHQQLTGG
ncbi:DUF4190 domain-containing protein [Kitasatospora sp. HPMI-4]|uniref:DUF4190 domain-containing protein n=1 Tax=Kitasatospora sp. HPMI-4 TaxID=3448443 RepID=UPI003F1CDC7A